MTTASNGCVPNAIAEPGQEQLDNRPPGSTDQTRPLCDVAANPAPVEAGDAAGPDGGPPECSEPVASADSIFCPKKPRRIRRVRLRDPVAHLPSKTVKRRIPRGDSACSHDPAKRARQIANLRPIQGQFISRMARLRRRNHFKNGRYAMSPTRLVLHTPCHACTLPHCTVAPGDGPLPLECKTHLLADRGLTAQICPYFLEGACSYVNADSACWLDPGAGPGAHHDEHMAFARTRREFLRLMDLAPSNFVIGKRDEALGSFFELKHKLYSKISFSFACKHALAVYRNGNRRWDVCNEVAVDVVRGVESGVLPTAGSPLARLIAAGPLILEESRDMDEYRRRMDELADALGVPPLLRTGDDATASETLLEFEEKSR